MQTPVEILSDLGLLKTNKKGKLKGTFKDFDIESMDKRKLSFDWIHLGLTDVQIGQLRSLLASNSVLIPPRTGHMGNWGDIAHGRAGLIDYNKTIIADFKVGYPLIYSNNQTEDAAMQNGDSIYLPGSIVEKGSCKELELYTWSGQEFIQMSRSNSLFTPFVLTPVEGKFVPITHLHWERMIQHSTFPFSKFDATVVENWELVSRILHILVESSIKDHSIELQDIFAHEVSLNGIVKRSSIHTSGNGFQVGDVYYSSVSELVNASMLPLFAVTKPDEFFGNMHSWPKAIPVISKLVSTILFPLLNTHYPNYDIDRNTMTKPFNPHFHWGALSFAGYPPYKKGTFANKDNIKVIEKMHQIIVDNFSTVDPTLFVLLPASPLTLCPTSAHEQDYEPVNQLLKSVQQSTVGMENKPNLMVEEINTIVDRWLGQHRNNLSGYYLNRFSSKRSVLNKVVNLPDYSRAIEVPAFNSLTFKQGSIIVGCLIEQLGNLV